MFYNQTNQNIEMLWKIQCFFYGCLLYFHSRSSELHIYTSFWLLTGKPADK